jgi:taurine dioxygenase
MGQLHVEEIGPGFGAKVSGLDTNEELNEEACRTLRAALDSQGLLLFRSLNLSRDFHEYLIRMLSEDDRISGDDYVSNKEPGAGVPFGRLLFHTDLMYTEHPYLLTSLYAVHVEPPVQPTTFASAKYAWDTLPEDLQLKVGDLYALQVNDASAGLRVKDEGDLLHVSYENSGDAFQETPLALSHPRSGYKILYVSEAMTQKILGISNEESDQLLATLFAHLYDPAKLWTYTWAEGDLIIWDNLAVQHSRPDIRTDGPVRTLRKVSSASKSRGKAGPVIYSRLGMSEVGRSVPTSSKM